jgi:hypothetical protein
MGEVGAVPGSFQIVLDRKKGFSLQEDSPDFQALTDHVYNGLATVGTNWQECQMVVAVVFLGFLLNLCWNVRL